MYIGIDWSENKHDVMFIDELGKRISHKVVEHSRKGFEKLEEARKKIGVSKEKCMVGLETAHNTIIDYLWETGYKQVYVIPPNVVNRSRDRYGQGGAKDDKRDAHVIADLLRTDVHRFQPWKPGSELSQQMKVATNLGKFWTKNAVALSNRLRSSLLRYYPAAIEVFRTWPSPIACHFVITYPTLEEARKMSYEEFKEFAKSHGHSQPSYWLRSYERIFDDYPIAASEIVSAHHYEGVQIAQLLLSVLKNKQSTLSHLQPLFQQHPDSHIFNSLPGAGKLLAPALLVKFGEDRKRFPSPKYVQAFAGTCPVTKSSGKKRTVRFRRACDKEFRYFIQQFARCSIFESEWAKAYYRQVVERSRSENHALRCLANRWLSIIWRLWQDRLLYDESIHLQRRISRHKPKA